MASAVARVNRRVPCRAGSAQAAVPSAATWQVSPGGQSPSMIPARPALRPACRTARIRAAAGRAGAAISAAGGRSAVPSLVRVAAGQAGAADQERLGAAQRGVQGRCDGQAGDRGRQVAGVPAGQQDGGVGGGHDDVGGPGRAAGQRAGQQRGEDRAGGRGGAGPGQAQAAQRCEVGGYLSALAHAQRDRRRPAAPARGPGSGRRGAVPGPGAAGRAGAAGRSPGMSWSSSPAAGGGGAAARRSAAMGGGTGGVAGPGRGVRAGR